LPSVFVKFVVKGYDDAAKLIALETGYFSLVLELEIEPVDFRLHNHRRYLVMLL